MIGINAGEWEGLDGMGEEMLIAMKPAAEKAMWEGGARFQAELKTQLSGARSGKTYKVSKTGAPHTASAEGESPAVLTGNLRNSMGFSRPKWKALTLEMEVGSGLGVGAGGKINPAYAMRLEWGGVSSHPWPVYIAPRPYMEPTAQRMEPLLQSLFEARL
jgi:hypothetical protein